MDSTSELSAKSIQPKSCIRTVQQKSTFDPKQLDTLFDPFKVGPYYSFTFLPSTRTIEHVSASITEILGYQPEEFTTDFFLGLIHPDDLPYFQKFDRKIADFKPRLGTNQEI